MTCWCARSKPRARTGSPAPTNRAWWNGWTWRSPWCRAATATSRSPSPATWTWRICFYRKKLRAPLSEIRTGLGWDVHRIAAGRPLILGGVTVPCEFGLEGHSDADVLAHAITDAILGAAALGDIGMHFPDTDPRWKGCDSLVFLRHAQELAEEAGSGSSTWIRP